MYQLIKLSVGSKLCSLTKITVPKPVLSIDPPICLFNFKVKTEAFIPPNENVELLVTVWELTRDYGDGFTSVISTIETTGNTNEVIFPREVLIENADYLVRAYHLTNIGESDWSDNINIKSGFVDTISFEPEILDNVGYEQGKHCIIHCNGNDYNLIWDGNSERIRIHKYDPDNAMWGDPVEYGAGLSIMNVGGRNSYGYPSDQPFSHCVGADNNIYFSAAIEYAPIENPHFTVFLFKFDTTTSTITMLASENTEIFKRDAPAMCYYNGALYFFGGYQIDVNGTVITPTEDEKTIIKYDLTNLTFSEVIVNGTVKPRNYRETKCTVVGDGVFTFSGMGSPLSNSRSPELWYFNFVSLEWEAKPMFTLGSLDECYMTMDVDSTDQYLNVLIDYQGSIALFNFFIESNFWEYAGNIDNLPKVLFPYLYGEYLYAVQYIKMY